MLPVLTVLEALRATVAPAAARLLRFYGAYQIRRALRWLQQLDESRLQTLTQVGALDAQLLGIHA